MRRSKLLGIISRAASASKKTKASAIARPLSDAEAVHLEQWVASVTVDMGLTESNSPIRMWREAIRKKQSFVVIASASADFPIPFSLTVVIPPGTTRQSAEKMALNHLFPVLSAVHGALVAYTGKKRTCHIVFVADKTFHRTLPTQPGAPIQPHHINGGLTTFGSTTHVHWRIMVYRWSDALKVMIHELVHIYDVHVLPPDSAAEAAFAASHGISLEPPIGRLEIREAVTEVIAIYILTIWTSVRESIPLKECIANVERQGDALALLVAKTQFPGWMEGKANYREGTHSYAYIIARAALWTQVDSFVSALESKSISSVRSLLALLDERQKSLFGRFGRLRMRNATQYNLKDLHLSPIQ